MKYTLPAYVCAAMIILAGCSSKKAASTTDQVPGAGSKPSWRSESPVSTEPVAPRPDVSVQDLSAEKPAAFVGLEIGDIFFEFDSSALSTEAQEQLKQNAAWLEKNPASKVTIQGHCDERGTDEYNMALGERRASAAREYLITVGVDSGRLSTVSFGEEMPSDPGHNEEAWSKNRRDHFIAQ